MSTVVVTGSTSKRTLLDTSVAVTQVNQQQLQLKAPRGTDDVLETIPGIYVQATAGPVSNNYSVRGLPGGSQQFVRLIEDGMPAIYGGLNDDEVFQYDLSIDRVEGLEGGTSGILTPNAAGASINFISRALNFDEAGGLIKATGSTYGEGRSDVWFSAPIKQLGDGVAFALSGFYDSTPGVRSSPFRYDTYHLKAQFEKKFNDGGFVKFTYKRWDEHDPYYADQPYAFNGNTISGVPGLSTQSGSIIGKGFGNIVIPDSCAANECTRNFRETDGIHAQGDQYRIDIDKPINDDLRAFARVRYTQTNWDFNGVFAGSGTGNSGLTSAVNYLNPAAGVGGGAAVSPIQSLLQMGLTAFPGTSQFGIKNLTTGQLIPASNVAALNALNGNGLLQQTVLNRQFIKLRDWGSDFGLKWDARGGNWRNSLTFGGQIYSQHGENDQSAVSPVTNDVRNDSNIYDIVALNAAGGVLGTLTNNGITSYGDWGQGINNWDQDSESFYFNDEFTFAQKLHIDIGLRYEHEHEIARTGGSTVAAVPAGTPGIIPNNPNAFDGTYTKTSGSENPVNFTVGANYTITSRLSVYARYADSYQTQGVNTKATGLKLYEGGVTFSELGFFGTVRGFRTEFDNTSFGGGVDPANANLNLGFFADLIANGMDLDVTYRPTYEPLHGLSIQTQATYQTSTFSNVNLGVITSGGQNVAQQAAAFYNGKTAAITPNWLFTIQPTYDLPNNLGAVYVRYKYIDSIFADNGNALALPSYGILSIGGIYNLTPRLQMNVSVDNLTNELGLTEGNPRAGFTQNITTGYFYGRGIVGTNAQFAVTYKF
ncbi:TonB-dependent receptor [Caulobacter sp. S45]|uniref:TonB-dependent receptor n=1 Tax=Caulobacter sp. S45 TaxID=1641861 RepID=UPI001C20619B|nr:TonB-dependent receptor [Caulobacter sp. S45]